MSRRLRDAAAERYRPDGIRVLVVAEAPPDALERFFFFEEYKLKDSSGGYESRVSSDIVYDFPAGGEGLASNFGQLSATLKNADWLKDAKGRIFLGAEGPRHDAKIGFLFESLLKHPEHWPQPALS